MCFVGSFEKVLLGRWVGDRTFGPKTLVGDSGSLISGRHLLPRKGTHRAAS